mmetsp:Transcript_3768/g.11664  ORF Transcript_3768/g.11664 Transcript_3768/m.11664 type:complete len:309 (-) Transcript_3768:1637-2563(-)
MEPDGRVGAAGLLLIKSSFAGLGGRGEGVGAVVGGQVREAEAVDGRDDAPHDLRDGNEGPDLVVVQLHRIAAFQLADEPLDELAVVRERGGRAERVRRPQQNDARKREEGFLERELRPAVRVRRPARRYDGSNRAHRIAAVRVSSSRAVLQHQIRGELNEQRVRHDREARLQQRRRAVRAHRQRFVLLALRRRAHGCGVDDDVRQRGPQRAGAALRVAHVQRHTLHDVHTLFAARAAAHLEPLVVPHRRDEVLRDVPETYDQHSHLRRRLQRHRKRRRRHRRRRHHERLLLLRRRRRSLLRRRGSSRS